MCFYFVMNFPQLVFFFFSKERVKLLSSITKQFPFTKNSKLLLPLYHINQLLLKKKMIVNCQTHTSQPHKLLGAILQLLKDLVPYNSSTSICI
jgi:hypothetical protein